MKHFSILLCLVISTFMLTAQDLVSGGSNSWILHTPDDGRTALFLAPMIGGSWDFTKQTNFRNDGTVAFSNTIYTPKLNVMNYLEIPDVNGTTYFENGTADGATLTNYNTFLSLHFGLGIGSRFVSDGSGGYLTKAMIVMNGRNGNIETLGNLYVKGANMAVYRDSDGWGRIYTKHLDAPTGQPLHLNYYSTATAVSIWGSGLTVNNSAFFKNKIDVESGKILIAAATNVDGSSPALVLRGNADDFQYDNAYINQYGFGFHGYQDGSTSYTEPTNSYMSGHFGIDFFTGSQHRMRISRSGEVSIGTAIRQSGYLLAVNGKIRSKEVVVEANWPDFVFAETYHLRPLSEVAAYIQENQHLPEIPSQAEVEQNGFGVGEMNAKLLQKIEELTLYLIEQNNANLEMSKKMEQMQAEIAALKKQ